MTAGTPDRLCEVFGGLQARLEGELRGNRAAVTHPGARGEAAEEDWLRVLKAHLPARYQADRAFVIDSRGTCSDQIDVVIYDRQYSPVLYGHADPRYVPAESTYAVFEVKQDLSREHVVYAGQKAATVRKLHRTSAPIPHAGGAYTPRPLPRISAGLLTYQSSWSPAFGEPLQNALASLAPEERLDLGCVLVCGAFEARDPEKAPSVLETTGADRSLVQFFLRLLRRLQSVATAPAIDYEEYLRRIS